MSQIALKNMCWLVTAKQKKTPTLKGINLHLKPNWILNSGFLSRLLNLWSTPEDVPGSQYRLPMNNFDPGWCNCLPYFDHEFESDFQNGVPAYFEAISQERLDHIIAQIGNYIFTVHMRLRKIIGVSNIPKFSFLG